MESVYIERRAKTRAADYTGQRRGSMNWRAQLKNRKVEGKRVRKLEAGEGCGQRVGSVNFMTSKVEPFQKMTKSGV